MKGDLLTVLYGGLGAIGFSFIFRVAKKKIPFTALGGIISCIFYVLTRQVCEYEFVQMLVASAAAMIYSEIMARVLKCPSTVFVAPAIIPLVPGGSLFYTMTYVVSSNMDAFLKSAYMTIELAGGIATGILIVSSHAGFFNKKKNKTPTQKK